MVRKLWFYNPPSNKALATVPAMVADTDVICLTMGQEREQWARDMRAAGFRGNIWLYWLQNSVHMVADPNRNNVGYVPGTYADLKKRVPAVFQYTLEGKIVLKNEALDYAVCDVAHPEWQKLFKQRTLETVNRNPDLWTGIWDDDLNVVFHVNGVGYVETKKYGKADSPEYFEALKGWLTYQRDQIAAPLGLRFGGNLQGSDLTRWETATDIMAANIGDGAGVVMNEHQFFAHDGEYLSVAEWAKDLKKVEIATRLGAEVWNVCPIDAEKAYEQPAGAEAAKIAYFMASHYLAADERAAVRIGREYALWFPFDLPGQKLGKAKGAYTVKDGIYRREFEGGYALVEPAAKRAEIQEVPIVDPPISPTVTLRVTLEFAVPAALAPTIKAAFDSLDVTTQIIATETTP